MAKKTFMCGITVIFACLGIVAVIHWAWTKLVNTHPEPMVTQGLPLSIEPLGGGVPSNLDSQQMFELLNKSNIFTYYIDQATGAKVPIDGMHVRVTGNRSAPAPSMVEKLELSLWRLTAPDGSIKLTSILDASAQYANKERVIIKISGQMTQISPKYEWEVDPNFYLTPPGIVQDLFLADSGSLVVDEVQKLSVDVTGKVNKQVVSVKDQEEIGAILKKDFRYSIIGRWQTGIGDVVRREALELDLSPGASVDFTLMKQSTLQVFIDDVSAGAVTLRCGSARFERVQIGQYRKINDFALLQLAGITKPAQPDKSPRLKLIIHYLDPGKAVAIGVTVRFKEMSDGEEVFRQDASTNAIIYESVTEMIDIEKGSLSRLRFKVRNIYNIRALRDISEQESDFEEWSNGAFRWYERWPGSEEEHDEGNTGKKYRIRFSMRAGETKTIVTGSDWVYEWPFKDRRKAPDDYLLLPNQDFFSYPSESDYIASLKIVISSESLPNLRSFMHEPSTHDFKDGRPPTNGPIDHTRQHGAGAEGTQRQEKQTSTISAEWKRVRPHERLTLYFEWG